MNSNGPCSSFGPCRYHGSPSRSGMAGLLSTEYVLALFAVEIYCAAQQRGFTRINMSIYKQDYFSKQR